jgi:hypothetical protein
MYLIDLTIKLIVFKNAVIYKIHANVLCTNRANTGELMM